MERGNNKVGYNVGKGIGEGGERSNNLGYCTWFGVTTRETTIYIVLINTYARYSQ